VRAPIIGEVTAGFVSVHASATCEAVAPISCAIERTTSAMSSARSLS
jgi:hypothetical protein